MLRRRTRAGVPATAAWARAPAGIHSRPQPFSRATGRERRPLAHRAHLESRHDRDVAGVHDLRARGRSCARRAIPHRGATDRMRQPAAGGAFALSMEGRGRGRPRGRGPAEDTQAGLERSGLAPPRVAPLRDAGVRRGPRRGRGAQVSGVARSRARAGGHGVSADARAASGPGAAAEAGATAAHAARPDRSAARLVLGIETSCDDCSAAVLEGGAWLRSHLIAGQGVHRLYGGVVPELASRAHLELLPRLVRQALAEAAVSPDELTAIAVTRAPGLVGSLVVGVAFARAYGLSLGIPVVGVNHVEAHLHAATLEHGESPLPAVSLVVSGGHTELVSVLDLGRYRWLGSTRDDAAGEAFDKVAKLLGLGFPGGPAIERLAREGDAAAYDFPRP